MAQIISASIDLSKIDKARIIPGKQGAKYYPFTIVVNDEPDKFGQDCAITEGQSKEERESKAKKVYIGNGKTVWRSTRVVDRSAPAQVSPPSNDDLPF